MGFQRRTRAGCSFFLFFLGSVLEWGKRKICKRRTPSIVLWGNGMGHSKFCFFLTTRLSQSFINLDDGIGK